MVSTYLIISQSDSNTCRQNQTISLNLNELRFLHDLVRLDWQPFVDDAPQGWKQDGWMTSRSPVGIVSLYGQNQPLATNTEAAAVEGRRWKDSRDYTKAKWLSYAVATHYECIIFYLTLLLF